MAHTMAARIASVRAFTMPVAARGLFIHGRPRCLRTLSRRLSAEEYRTPPANDPRYTGPPTYPSHLLKPVFKVKDEEKGMSRPVFGGGSPGMMPIQ